MIKATILAIDDSPETLDILKAALAEDYHIRLTSCAERGLKLAESQHPDLILLDVAMPVMSGYEVCQALKMSPNTEHIPVIMVSAMSEVDDELGGFKFGAVDYIHKPISIPILRARIETQLELAAAKLVLQQEREELEQIVYRMANDPSFDYRFIRHASCSEEINSGDLTLSAFQPDGTQHLMLCDFTGHGLSAAIGIPLVSHVFYSRTQEGVDLANILVEINNLLSKVLPVHIFMALGAVAIDPARSRARVWNCGMEDILLFSSNDDWRHFRSQNLPLGIIVDNILNKPEEVGFTEGQRFYLFTDGITEAIDLSNDRGMFGMARVKKSLVDNITQHETLDGVVDTVTIFINKSKGFDDMTLVELNCSGIQGVCSHGW
ncbi:MAG: fused response regulator/phosphatase [Cycloclasticus sp.]